MRKQGTNASLRLPGGQKIFEVFLPLLSDSGIVARHVVHRRARILALQSQLKPQIVRAINAYARRQAMITTSRLIPLTIEGFILGMIRRGSRNRRASSRQIPAKSVELRRQAAWKREHK